MRLRRRLRRGSRCGSRIVLSRRDREWHDRSRQGDHCGRPDDVGEALRTEEGSIETQDLAPVLKRRLPRVRSKAAWRLLVGSTRPRAFAETATVLVVQSATDAQTGQIAAWKSTAAAILSTVVPIGACRNSREGYHGSDLCGCDRAVPQGGSHPASWIVRRISPAKAGPGAAHAHGSGARDSGCPRSSHRWN